MYIKSKLEIYQYTQWNGTRVWGHNLFHTIFTNLPHSLNSVTTTRSNVIRRAKSTIVNTEITKVQTVTYTQTSKYFSDFKQCLRHCHWTLCECTNRSLLFLFFIVFLIGVYRKRKKRYSKRPRLCETEIVLLQNFEFRFELLRVRVYVLACV